jgi:hypothetical protein
MLDWCINFMLETPDEIVQRTKKFDPRDPLIDRIFTMIRQSRENGTEAQAIARIRNLVNGSLPRQVVAS